MQNFVCINTAISIHVLSYHLVLHQLYIFIMNLPLQDTAHHPEYAGVRRQQPTQAQAPSQ